jgi:putative transposase
VSLARPILKGVSLMLNRRVRGRTFLLRPCKRTNQIVGYVAAVMATRWNILIHALVVMSNHWHVCLTDPDGRVVEFQRDCHQFITPALNAPQGEFESLWASAEATSRVECEEPDDLVNQIAYTMANPVEAVLVRYGKSWPGLRRAWPSKPLVFPKPKKFFRGHDQGGSWPAQAALELSRPPGYDELSDDELAGLLAGAIDEREEKFRRPYDGEGRPFLSRRGVLEQSRYDCPRTRGPRFGISPKVACRNKWRRIERLRANQRWLGAYLTARSRWCEGDRDVVFPAGTYQMRVVHGVTCAQLPG